MPNPCWSPATVAAIMLALTFVAPLPTQAQGTIPPAPSLCRKIPGFVPGATLVTTSAGTLYQLDQPAVDAVFPVVGVGEFAFWSAGDYQAGATGFSADEEIGHWALAPGPAGWSAIIRPALPADRLRITVAQRVQTAPALCILAGAVAGTDGASVPEQAQAQIFLPAVIAGDK